MGVFDYVRCDYPLPNGTIGAKGSTSAFECTMATIVIDAQGQLWEDHGQSHEVPKEERTYPDAPEGTFRSIFGCMRWEPKPVASTWTGSLWLDGGWCAVIVRGKLAGFESHDGFEYIPLQEPIPELADPREGES